MMIAKTRAKKNSKIIHHVSLKSQYPWLANLRRVQIYQYDMPCEDVSKILNAVEKSDLQMNAV